MTDNLCRPLKLFEDNVIEPTVWVVDLWDKEEQAPNILFGVPRQKDILYLTAAQGYATVEISSLRLTKDLTSLLSSAFFTYFSIL